MNPSAWEQNNPTLPSVPFLRDSFSNALLQYVPENFSRTDAVWTYVAKSDILAAEHPDIVILEIIQRKLRELADTDLADNYPPPVEETLRAPTRGVDFRLAIPPREVPHGWRQT